MSRKVYVTKEFTFDCAHFLNGYEGKCALMHGHTYKLQVTLYGTPKDNGILMDFSEIKKLVEEEVINKLDHTCLNDFFGTFNTTAENLVVWIFDQIERAVLFKGVSVDNVKLWETPTCFTEYRGE